MRILTFNNSMNRDDAIQLAADFISAHGGGHGHGKCLSATLVSRNGEDTWEIEFAYEGMEERSETTDPPSIVIAVDLPGGNVRLASLM